MGKLFSNAKAIKEAKEAAGQQQTAGIMGAEAASAQTARNIAAEQTKSNIFMSLGSGVSGSADAGAATGNIFDPDAQRDQDLKKMASYGGFKFLKGKREGIIDPDAYTEQTQASTSFAIRDLLTAESLSLLKKEGPEWDMLENSTLGTIYEGAALQLRDTMRQLKNNYAKGGTARRTAINEFGEIQAAESAMRMRVQETWQANLGLYDTVHKAVDNAQSYASTFMQSLPLVNDQYRAAMMHTAEMQIQASQLAMQSTMNAYNTKMTQQPRNFGTKLLEGVIKLIPTAVATVFGGPGAGMAVGKVMNEADGSGTGGGQALGGLLTSGMDYIKNLGGDGSVLTKENTAGYDISALGKQIGQNYQDPNYLKF